MNEKFDVSILFGSVAEARVVWAEVLQGRDAECSITDGHLVGLGFLDLSPMPLGELDTRLMSQLPRRRWRLTRPPGGGAAHIGIVLGSMSQFAVRQMLTNPATGESPYPHPWGEGGVIGVCSHLVRRSLLGGGTAVVLHKAAGTIKPKELFLEELSSERHLAWLDLTASSDGHGGVVSRCYGMPHYFGWPNVQAGLPTADFGSVECSMAAVRYLCRLITEENDSPYSITKVCVPSFSVADVTLPSVEWQATYDEEAVCIMLRVDDL